MTNEELTATYNEANCLDPKRHSPITTERIFAAMRAAMARERHDCEVAVWLVRQEAEKPDAPDEGVSGWLQEAEDRIRMRSNAELRGAEPIGEASRSNDVLCGDDTENRP